jgi:hypothetical protein
MNLNFADLIFNLIHNDSTNKNSRLWKLDAKIIIAYRTSQYRWMTKLFFIAQFISLQNSSAALDLLTINVLIIRSLTHTLLIFLRFRSNGMCVCFSVFIIKMRFMSKTAWFYALEAQLLKRYRSLWNICAFLFKVERISRSHCTNKCANKWMKNNTSRSDPSHIGINLGEMCFNWRSVESSKKVTHRWVHTKKNLNISIRELKN